MTSNYFNRFGDKYLGEIIREQEATRNWDYDTSFFQWEIDTPWKQAGRLLLRNVPRPVQTLEDKITTPPRKRGGEYRQFRTPKRLYVSFGRWGVGFGYVVCIALGVALGKWLFAARTVHYVRFSLVEPDARVVAVSGDFNHWGTTELEKDPITGVWHAWIAVPQGRHRYVFILNDDQRVVDPSASERASDGDGSEVAILYVPSKTM